ncbi:hypothetical protein POM88_023021 [Heracleum sosnowskyi]|uniref:Uncharacterized protein n=1 Tax=Heracleum sosnowskyi TaxID=360622 RepID=A0AAD8IHY6_9APIA|nr:hypothetical protein POM88_023021 [Heracleum sosnowskyi]
MAKRRGSQLEVRVRKTYPRKVLGPCPAFWNSPDALRISFFTHNRKQYLDSSSTLLRAEEETTGANGMCFDNRVFFKRCYQQVIDSIAISELLDSLQVKRYLHDRITRQIMSMGQPKYRGGKKVKRKVINGGHGRICAKASLKLVLLDEADAMTKDAQFALRRVIEKYTKSTSQDVHDSVLLLLMQFMSQTDLNMSLLQKGMESDYLLPKTLRNKEI